MKPLAPLPFNLFNLFDPFTFSSMHQTLS